MGAEDYAWNGASFMPDLCPVSSLLPKGPERGYSRSMTTAEIIAALEMIRQETDLNAKALLGEVTLIPVEDALVGRVYAARCYCSGYDEKDDECAKKLMTAVLLGHLPIDWEETRKIAACPKFNCLSVFEAFKTEVEAELAKSRS